MEGMVSAVPIAARRKITMQGKYIIHQAQLKFLYISLPSFSLDKLFPCIKQIFDTRYFLKTMSQLDFHKNFSAKSPPAGTVSIIQRFVAVYKLWDEFKNHLPKKSRYTISAKIDLLCLGIIELLFIASRLPKQQKLPYLFKASIKLDTLKFFLQICWELRALDNKKYIALSDPLNEIGKMLGGWIKGLQKETPPVKKGGEQSEFRTAANR